jgi:hypothetical protein
MGWWSINYKENIIFNLQISNWHKKMFELYIAIVTKQMVAWGYLNISAYLKIKLVNK